MSGYHPLLKKPKIEIEEEDPEEEEKEEEDPEEESNDGEMEEQIRNEQEEALVALIEHRTKEVEHLRQRITYYKSQLEEAEKRLEDTQSKLARLRGWNIAKSSKNSSNGREEVKVERKSPSPMKMNESSSQKQSLHQRQDALRPSVDNLNITKKPPSPFHKDENSSQNHCQSKPPLVIPSVNPNLSQPIKTKEPGPVDLEHHRLHRYSLM